MSQELPDCCKPKQLHPERKGFLWGIVYGLLPHTFCILFVVFAVIGTTAGSAFLKKFFIIPHFFQILVGLSLIFAAISATIYLRRSHNFSLAGMQQKWRYLTILFVTTISINLLFFYVIFPAAGNIGVKSPAAQVASANIQTENGVQIVRMTQTGRGYTPNVITLKKGVPVKWIITGTNTGFCDSSVISSQLNIRKDLALGENVIEFTPQQSGKIKFNCIMGMYSGYFNVVG